MTINDSQTPVPAPDLHSPAEPRRPLGLPFIALVGLALLAVPRVVLHDLHLIEEGTFVNALLVFVPVAVWIVVAVVKRVPHPFLTLLVVGALYGVFLAAGHQLLWGFAFDQQPQLGGVLANLTDPVQIVIMRVFAAISSLFTGVVVGAVSGLIAWGIAAIVRRGASAEGPSA